MVVTKVTLLRDKVTSKSFTDRYEQSLEWRHLIAMSIPWNDVILLYFLGIFNENNFLMRKLSVIKQRFSKKKNFFFWVKM